MSRARAGAGLGAAVGAGAGGGLVKARPTALRSFAAQGGSRVTGMGDAATHVSATAARLNASAADPEFAVRVPDLGGPISALTARWTQLDGYVNQVAAGFEAADVLGGPNGGLAMADPAAIDRGASFPKDFNPLSRVVPGDPAVWQRAVYGDKVLPRGVTYGGGGFLRLPDGRLLPLVIPQVRGKDGRWYSADDGPGGDVSTLDGRDPGWVRQLEVRGIGSLFDRPGGKWAAALIALTGGAVPINSAPAGDYAGLRRGDGRPRWISGGRTASPGGIVAPSIGKENLPVPQGGTESPVTGRPRTAGATGISIAINGLDGINKVENSKVGAYDVVVERNADGRERARVQVTTMSVGANEERQIRPTHLFVDGDGRTQGALVSYRGQPDPNVAVATEGHRDDDPGYDVTERSKG